jgi:hypothetical protein
MALFGFDAVNALASLLTATASVIADAEERNDA